MAAPASDVASASSAALFRLRHLRLGLDLRPEARALAGCLVLELCALRADRRALVLDTHPALRVASVAFRPCGPAGHGEAEEEDEEDEEACRRRRRWRCGFVFPSAGPGSPPWELSGGPEATALPGCRPLADPHPHCPLERCPPGLGASCAPGCPLRSPSPCPLRTPEQPPQGSPRAPCCPLRTPEPPPPGLLRTPEHPSSCPLLPPEQPSLGLLRTPEHPSSCPLLTPEHPTSCSLRTPEHPSSCPLLTPEHPTSCSLRTPEHPSSCPLLTPEHPSSCFLRTPEHLSSCPLLTPEQPPSGPLRTPEHPPSCLLLPPEHPSSFPLLTPEQPASGPLRTPERPPSCPLLIPEQPPPGLLRTPEQPLSGTLRTPEQPPPCSPLAHPCPLRAPEQPLPCPPGAPLTTHAGCPHLSHGCAPGDLDPPPPPLVGCVPPGAPVSPRPATPSACTFANPPPEMPTPPLPAFSDSPAARPLVFRVDPFTDYGSSLTVFLPSSLEPHQPFQVVVRYTTTDAPAIWWLDPELTYGMSKPFVFTQGHSVCNRSFFPCFDTPAVKCSYSAVVKAPAGMQVLMSATQSSYKEQEGVYEFYMEYPVPAYLVALVAGDLVPADIGPRSRVWAEPCLLETAIGKLSGRVERWLSAAESLYGPYIWGRYDIVFLPPSFPIVAMENPCLTFIISSILESDEFLIIDVIHEVAHSWFGNAVTNATWEEMWLSEGLATYAQRRITTETYGAAFTCLETAFRLDALHRQMKLLGEDNPVSKLQVKLEPGVNPSNLMNLFTYEKGYCFVYYLSQLCGDPARFDAFLRAYIEKYKFTSVVAQDLLDSFLAFFPELKEQCIDSKTGLEFERWLNATGPPLAEPDLSQGSSLTSPVEMLFNLWMAEPLDVAAASSCVDITKWQTFQTVLFLDRLLDGSPLPHEVISKLSECYSAHLDSMNAEIRIRWLQIIVRNDYYPDLHKVRLFLENQMSRMYTIPLYEDLCAGTLKPFALEVFYQTQSQLHPNLRKTIQQILTQGLNPLLALDAAAAAADASAAGLEDKVPEAANGAISLRDVNVSA